MIDRLTSWSNCLYWKRKGDTWGHQARQEHRIGKMSPREKEDVCCRGLKDVLMDSEGGEMERCGFQHAHQMALIYEEIWEKPGSRATGIKPLERWSLWFQQTHEAGKESWEVPLKGDGRCHNAKWTCLWAWTQKGKQFASIWIVERCGKLWESSCTVVSGAKNKA